MARRSDIWPTALVDAATRLKREDPERTTQNIRDALAAGEVEGLAPADVPHSTVTGWLDRDRQTRAHEDAMTDPDKAAEDILSRSLAVLSTQLQKIEQNQKAGRNIDPQQVERIISAAEKARRARRATPSSTQAPETDEQSKEEKRLAESLASEPEPAPTTAPAMPPSSLPIEETTTLEVEDQEPVGAAPLPRPPASPRPAGTTDSAGAALGTGGHGSAQGAAESARRILVQAADPASTP